MTLPSKKLKRERCFGASRGLQQPPFFMLLQLVYMAVILVLFFKMIHLSHFSHVHPRLLLAIECGAGLFFVGMVDLVLHAGTWVNSRAQRARPPLQVHNYLNRTVATEVFLTADETFDALDVGLNLYAVKTDDTRFAQWQPIVLDREHRCMKFALQYHHTSTGRRPWQLYPRTIVLDVKLTARGLHTLIEWSYCAPSLMDYRNVQDLTKQTTIAIYAALSNYRNVAAA